MMVMFFFILRMVMMVMFFRFVFFMLFMMMVMVAMMNYFSFCAKESFVLAFRNESRKLCRGVFEDVPLLLESVQSLTKLLVAVERVAGNPESLEHLVVFEPARIDVLQAHAVETDDFQALQVLKSFL